jgi:hypothetical protein
MLKSSVMDRSTSRICPVLTAGTGSPAVSLNTMV